MNSFKNKVLLIIQIITLILTLILTKISVDYSFTLRGYTAIGGEYFIPFLGIFIILILEKSKEEK